MMNKIQLRITGAILLPVLLFACETKKENVVAEFQEEPLTTIAFGSCNRQDRDQPLWDPIISHQPDLFIWLGDNIYGDTDSMQVLKAKYELQNSNPGYQRLKAQSPIIGIWDDHDFGRNDAGTEYPHKKESRDLMFEFLDLPKSNPAWNREGAYNSFTYGPKGKQVKVILLDARYFRDSLIMEDRVYLPNESGTVLGEEQWAWLENELKENQAQVTLIGSGIQMLPRDHQFEKWANFPYERERLLNMLKKHRVQGAILLSGDRHIAEISQIELEGIEHPIYEVTSSGLTHTWREYREEPNRYRVGEMIAKLNFGIINLDWKEKEVNVTLEVRGREDSLFLTQNLRLPLSM
ncbi:alkaline phosphatase D [Algoriphagus ornithinivorans]|uniref:Alkaline phosphatase D n=1 Tax=Algoriphagus ornithinivorans TaxID=226506 RepID=A0A1I5IIQ8_9BACT|nr:alkaline phosphatase D family protein [Algoriphagus ornithinivorans]SFO60447.1 alkaline phosphatase D [Algoriphagus ornithinivorans]